MIKTKNQTFNNLLTDSTEVLLEIFKDEVNSVGKKVWLLNLKEVMLNRSCNFKAYEVIRFGTKTSDVLSTLNNVFNSFINSRGLETNTMNRYIINLGYNKNSSLSKYHFKVNNFQSTIEKHNFVLNNFVGKLHPKSLEKYFCVKLHKQLVPKTKSTSLKIINTFNDKIEESLSELIPYVSEYNFKLAKSTIDVLKTILIKGIE